MEAATLSETPAVQDAPTAVAEVPTSKLFEWSGDVHVGEGASTCNDAVHGTCTNADHFHAWICLANAFQTRDIGDKARAAKARKIRAMRDAGGDGREASDSYVTLEAILDEVARENADGLIDEVVQESVAKQLGTIFRELKEDERFVNSDQDSEELSRQQLLPEDERDADEFAQLQQAQEDFAKELEGKVKERTERERETVERLPDGDRLELLRTKRINEQASEAYMHAYYTWLMFVGTRKLTQHNARLFSHINDLKMAAPEVVAALREKLNELENNIQAGRGGSGNS